MNTKRTTEIVTAPAPWVEQMEQANRMLAQVAGDPFRASRLWDIAEAARVYARQMKLGVESTNHATAVKLKAELLMAEAVDKGQAEGKIAARGNPGNTRAPGISTLDEIGITSQRASEARKIRDRFTAADIDSAVVEANEAGEELSTAGLLAKASGVHVSQASGENEWYTPANYIDSARFVMGGTIDLDPASNATANEVVGATEFYSINDDGLTKRWKGAVWMNPPYARPLVDEFCSKLAESFSAGDVTQACVLVNNATETGWFHALAEVASAMCFPRGRVKFWHPERESAPLQGQAVVYLGPSAEAFRGEFVRFGFTVSL